MSKNSTSNLTVFKKLSDYLPDSIVMTDLNLKIVYANQAVQTTLGYTEDELIGQMVTILWEEEDFSLLQTSMPQIMKECWSGETQNKRKDGSLTTGLCTAFSLGDDSNQSSSLLAFVIHDITKRRQTEIALDQQNRILHTLLENMPFGTFMVEAPSGKPVLTNQKAIDFTGRGIMPDATEDDLAEVYEAYRYGTDEIYPTMDMPIIRGMYGEVSHIQDMEVRRPDGTRTLLEVFGSPVYDKEGKVQWSLVNLVDITERKRAEVEREELQQDIIEAQRRALQELSTPIIPVMEGVIVMPLIGSVDSMRAKDITRTLLAGVREHRAKVVILDITGVPLVDSGVASHLNKTIVAARLKGAQTIVTGISNAVAETVVDLGIDWSSIETLADLQTGLVSALAKLGLKLVRI